MIWWLKKGKDKKEEEKEIPVEVNSPEYINVLEPIENKLDFKGKIEDHNEFNTIVDIEGMTCMFRFNSSTSHEIVRLNCVDKEYKFNSIKSDNGIMYYYVTGVTITPYVKRLFITDAGRFFYQIIHNTNNATYCPTDRERIQKDMRIWESSDRMSKPITHDESYVNGHWVVQPGKYDKSKITCSGTYTWNWASYIETYDIVDQKLYDTKLIEVF